MDNKKNTQQQGPQINLNLDSTPIYYTDNIFMTTNSDGVVLDIGQRVASTNQVRIVARIGMSREHTKKFVNKLGNLLVMSEGKIQTGKANLN